MGAFLVPFNEIDEACLSATEPERPFNIEVEVRLPGRFDVRRLRAALSVTARAHPIARARLAPSAPFDDRNHWQILPRPDVDPLIVVSGERSAGEEIRAELLERLIPIEKAPPFRLLLTRSRGGDRLTLVMSHVASDGIGSLRLLRSIALAYSREREPAARVGFLEARSLERHFSRAGSSAWNRRMRAVGGAQLEAWFKPASRLAPVATPERSGTLVHHVRISRRITGWLAKRRSPATVNDLLLIALTRAIETWNARAGRSADKIALVVPVNLRPAEWRREVVANLSLATVVTTRASERADEGELAGAVVRQTAGAKADLACAGFVDLYRIAAGAPNFWKRGVSRLLGATTAARMMPTAILSNLGAELDPVSFGRAGKASELWFSPPYPAPTCLSVGAVTYAGRLLVSLRCSRKLLPPKGLAAFAALLGECLATLATGRQAGAAQPSEEAGREPGYDGPPADEAHAQTHRRSRPNRGDGARGARPRTGRRARRGP
jgi:NRPS condensation-like uncharacterized protein